MSNGGKQGDGFGVEEIVAAVVVFALILWFAVGGKLSVVMAYIRFFETWVIGLFSPSSMQVAQSIKAGGFQPMSYDAFTAMMRESGRYARFFCIPLLAVPAAYVLLKSPVDRFRRKHSLKSLLTQEAAIWKEVAPVLAISDELVRDLSKFPPSLTEWEFARRHNLLTSEEGQTPVIDKDRARAVFRRQLGPRWRGFGRLPKHVRVVVAILLIRLDPARSDDAVDIARRVADEFAKNGGIDGVDDTFVKDEFSKFKNIADFTKRSSIKQIPSAKEVLNATLRQHAYVYTVVANLFYGAGMSGVFPSALFVWLKQVDRRFWYVLNNCGRYSFHVEALGPYAHWLAERALKLPGGCAFPMIESGVDELEKSLALYNEENLLDKYLDDYAINSAKYVDWNFIETFGDAATKAAAIPSEATAEAERSQGDRTQPGVAKAEEGANAVDRMQYFIS